MYSIRDVRKCYICCLHSRNEATANVSFHAWSACLTFMQKRCENHVAKEWNRVRSESRDRHVEHLLQTGGAKSPRDARRIMRCGESGGSKHAHARARTHKRARAHEVCNSTANMSVCRLQKVSVSFKLQQIVLLLNYPIIFFRFM